MALGYCPYVLRHLKTLQGNNYGGYKITAAGFLRYLLQQKGSISNYNDVVSGDDGSGHIKEVHYKYRPRVRPSQTVTTDTCDIELFPEWAEGTIPRTLFRKAAFHISNETIARYCNDASQMVKAGTPPTSFMAEHMDFLKSLANGLLGAMNSDLLGIMATNFGINAVTGSNAAVTVNIAQDTTVNDLSSGIVKILADAQFNELCGNLSIVGSGLFNNAEIQRQFMQCCDEKGMNTSNFTGFNWYHDIYASTTLGANQIAVLADNTAFLVDINRFTGFRAGDKGTSTFFNMMIPVAIPGCNEEYPMGFDVQLKFNDCPVEGEGYGGATLPVGWAMYVSKSFDLFVPPSNYSDGDRLQGTNGALRYAITNV